MKKIYKYFTVLALTIVGVISCSDDFTDVNPPYAINSDTYFASPDDYSKALIGAYDVLQSTYVNVILGEIASDNANAGGESANDVIGWQQVDRMQHTPINDNLDDIWDWNFAGVQRAAFIIENQDNIEFDGKMQIIAEARFLRAYFNFELLKWFGPIPIKPEGQFVLGEVTSIQRSPKEEVYAFIEDDLLYAIENIAVDAPEIGRATRGSAQALLGKVYLYQERFEESANQLNSVINSGKYHLYGTEGDEVYETLFDSIGQNSAEAVFEIQYTGAEGAGFDCLQCSEGNVMVGFSGIRGYNGPVFESGYGFNLPTEEAYNSFESGDLRQGVTVLDIESWASSTGASYNIGSQDPITGHTGYYNRKYLPRQNDNKGDTNLTQPNNYRAIRYADVLLMAAEAMVRGNINEGQARNYLNMVRNRASLDNVDSSGNSLLEDIYADRRSEMMGEGHRFFDLVRTGRAAENIQGFTTGKNEVFPIPLEELQFSNGNWEQNPGY
ncbi:RagB/SusD family nutrient uptake outer membrane protein [Mesonia aestuariivivens]|uniref:RagB/SusD family nutrient uptake outer membrane protein n=1 Tax=Mesonia aestuariivivens TaxID=2796128 RepID=A0ABS6W332_9FLAO|nr:RagB/SusD family nutrient uptake outer membrane protein [Mesonia aestuariivivens]MBW2962266.1 RagB/SusD family nutrient uptake outer membrane protein [Mesonia aestuariivivens]